MNLNPTDCRSNLTRFLHRSSGSIAGKLLIASLGLALIGSASWWFIREKASPPPNSATKPFIPKATSKNRLEDGFMPPTPGSPGSQRSQRMPQTNALPATPTGQVNWPNQLAWKRSLLEANPDAWQREIGVKLATEFKPEVLAYFRAQTNITVRQALAWPLARMGGDDVFQVLTAALTNDYRTASLGLDDTVALSLILRAMHPMTTNTPGALEFARQGIEFEFWRANRPFAANKDAEGTMEREVMSFYVKAAISVLGRSTAPDIPELLESLRKRDINYTYYTSGALVGAAAEQDRKKRFPVQAATGFDADWELRWFKYWQEATPEGKEWSKWSAGIAKQRPTER